MRCIATVLLLFITSISDAQTMELSEVRKQYVESALREEAARDLLKSLSQESALSPVLLAYKGATQALMAKYATLPGKKYSLAKKGLAFLEQAIAIDPENIEIRYLRFTIQENVPSFLGLSKDLKNDKIVILKNAARRKEFKVDDPFFKEIARFLIDSDECSEEEIAQLKKEALLD